MDKVENSDKKKEETPAEILNSLVGKELTDVDIEEYAERLKVARENKKKARNDKSAKILPADEQASESTDVGQTLGNQVSDNQESDNQASNNQASGNRASDSQESDNQASNNQVSGSQASEHDKNKQTEKSAGNTVKVKGTNVGEDAATKIGAFVFFGIFGVIQIWLIIDWLIRGCLLDTLALHLLPVIIVVCLFAVTSVIDLINNRGKKKEQVKKEEAVKKRSNKKHKKGGK